ncbi:STE3-domain-containing protein [Athelia psychrophila]|uniref:STE3-domain-containing protein n=1 Tax=Athelia psychrophila TaxID=1759441 RepID=A0A166R498_9AGAM|nr:STE3-domain-containing protein [Fibularhizoctonia sp. CBS 109695]
MGAVPQWLYSTCAFLGFAMCVIPLKWHLEAWNTGTVLYMTWTGLGCLNYFINSVVWADNVLIPYPLWCDISTKFQVGLSVGIPCAALCMMRRLYMISTISSVTTTKQERRRAVYVDLAIGLGVPFLQMIVHIFVQGHRFTIYEQVGCFPTFYDTPLAFVLVYSWPTIIGMISAVYCILTIRALAKRRSEYNAMLSGGGVNSSRYLRLMALASVDVLCTTPLSSYLMLYMNSKKVYPYLGWADTHFDFNAMDQFPAFVWRANHDTVVAIELSRWSPILCAFIFFGFFGFAQEARKHYRLAFDSVARRIGYTSRGSSSGGVSSSFGGGKYNMSQSGKASLPVFINQTKTTKRDSVVSFSTNLDFDFNDVGGALADVKPFSHTDKVFSPTDKVFSPTDSLGSSGSGSFDEDSFDDKASITEPPRALTREAPPHYEDQSARPESQTINMV